MPVLDPRPEVVARACPWDGAANIPCETLADRRHELPGPGATVLVGDCEDAQEACDLLRTLGRAPEIVPIREAETARQIPLWNPNAVLSQVVETIPLGSALDLGCGTGRDAVWLATQGWTVTAVDHLPDALTRVEALAKRYAPKGSVRTELMDLRHEVPQGDYDLAWMAYGLFEAAFRECRAEVKALETFAPCHRGRYGKPARTLTLETCRSWNLGRELLAQEGWRDDRCTVRYAVQSA